MSWTGAPGDEGYQMPTAEALSSITRLILTRKLHEAVSECSGRYWLVPYYGWNPQISQKELLPQITLQYFISKLEKVSFSTHLTIGICSKSVKRMLCKRITLSAI